MASEIVGGPDEGLFTVPVSGPKTDDDHLRAYWFDMTEAGKAEWEAGHEVLDDYRDENPI